jgi:hypothetical protein
MSPLCTCHMIVSKIVLPPITEQGPAPSLRIGSLKTRSPTFLPPVLYCQRRQRLLTGMHIQASPTKEKKCPATLRTRSSNFWRSLPMLNTRAYLHLHDFILCILAYVCFSDSPSDAHKAPPTTHWKQDHASYYLKTGSFKTWSCF